MATILPLHPYERLEFTRQFDCVASHTVKLASEPKDSQAGC